MSSPVKKYKIQEKRRRKNKMKTKGQLRLMLGMIVLLFGALGIFFWGLGIVLNSSNSMWIGKIIIGLISLIVLIIERLIK